MEDVFWLPKLYVVTRKDLPIGVQACQLAHAAREFAYLHTEMEEEWFEKSNAICFLSVGDEESLEDLIHEATGIDLKYAPFYEEALDKALTAVAFEPTLRSRKLLSQIPLAFC